jgi:hypothetical protein
MWAEADIGAAAAALRGVADDAARAASLAGEAARFARRHFTAAPLLGALRDLGLEQAA